MREIMKRFLHEIQLGLKKETHPKADIKCFVTYVQDLPNGKGTPVHPHNFFFLILTDTFILSFTEKGKFLALDLGGTNFRVLLIHLKGDSEFEMQSKIYAIPQSIMIGSGAQLFDHIAECLANFIKVNRFFVIATRRFLTHSNSKLF
jgi:hexokinase